MKLSLLVLLLVGLALQARSQERKRAREYGIRIGVLPTGVLNAITDVQGVRVGHTTLVQGQEVRTGVTAIVPHAGNVFQQKIPAAVYVGNGFGKLAGSTQVVELGNLETPIVLTNTLSVGTAMKAVVEYVLRQPGNEAVQSVNALVGETNDGGLNDIRGRYITEQHVLAAIEQAQAGPVAEGNVGAGTGTVCFGFKGGIGTASRLLPAKLGGYTVGVLVQTNFGGVLQVNGAPVGQELEQFYLSQQLKDRADGSCMIVVATDAPVDARNLERLAKRAFLGLGKTGGIATNGSGDYIIAFSTHPGLRVPYASTATTQTTTTLTNEAMSPLFLAVIEATEEAIINSLFKAETMQGKQQQRIEALPLDKVLKILKQHHAR
ncbi:D-aminopeptidase [Hymenobacter qilianensis]|uniref:D-aminopeptidase n=2 Tax=Hymenobacter qilianensis TaxID=1385715 RepID=A0ACB5PVI2_9BACT|nr:P1 family peptidase [Hymenobacter qilianensis]QNP51356.1 P1 family peptidase [Hymenobacter qilianensis]GGF76072.1 D-aminopeptidase [Hymenobacter qilianensis]